MIRCKDFSFQYKGADRPAIQHLNLEIAQGDFVGIIGKSGAGKTTLTYALNGIVPHYFPGDFYGEVNVFGMDTVEVRPEKLSLTVGSVLQDTDAQMVASVVEDELLFGLENFGVPKGTIASRMQEALESVGISSLRNREIRSLSGGQKQKVAIAAILALRPQVVVLDEPTGELDPQSSRQVYQILKELNEAHGITVIAVEQKIMQLCEFSKKLLVMDEGRCLFYDTVPKVLAHHQELEQIGVNVPRVVTLAGRLAELGLSPDRIPVNIDEAEQMVRRLIYGHA